MAEAVSGGEAAPQKNTAVNLNPIEIDESFIARLLEAEYSKETPKPQEEAGKAVETESTTEGSEVTGEPESTEETSEVSEDVVSQDEGKEGEEEDTPPERDGVQKRIDKLTAQKREAQERAEALERELQEARAKLEEVSAAKDAPPPAPQADNPFGNVWEETRLQGEWEKARELLRWCRRNENGAVVGEKEYTADDIAGIRDRVEDAIDIHIPRRAAFLQQYKQAKPVAEKLYPFWKDRKSVEYSEAQEVLRAMPGLGQLPEHQILIGDFLTGRKARLEREKDQANPKPKPIPKPAPKQPGVPTAAPTPRADDSKRQYEAARAKFLETASQSDLAKMIERRL